MARAREIAESAAHQVERKFKDLTAADASEARGKVIAAPQKLAEEARREARQRSSEVGAAAGNVIASLQRPTLPVRRQF